MNLVLSLTYELKSTNLLVSCSVSREYCCCANNWQDSRVLPTLNICQCQRIHSISVEYIGHKLVNGWSYDSGVLCHCRHTNEDTLTPAYATSTSLPSSLYQSPLVSTSLPSLYQSPQISTSLPSSLYQSSLYQSPL